MKKLTYLMMILFTVVLMSTSCEKDDSIVFERITVEDLVGDWYFQSLEFNGKTTYDCDVDLNYLYTYVTLDFRDMTTTNVMLYTDCMDNGRDPDDRVYKYTLNNNIIDCEDGSRKFKILNTETFNGTKLVLELVSGRNNTLLIGGIYTLEKQ